MPKKVFIDCGTNLAQGLIKISKEHNIDSDWIVYSFEANPEVYKLMNHSLFPNVTFINKAVWISNEKIKMIEVYHYILYTYFINTPIYNLLQITYFKNFLENILKYIIYMNLIKIDNIIDKIIWDKNVKNLIKNFETTYLKKYYL